MARAAQIFAVDQRQELRTIQEILPGELDQAYRFDRSQGFAIQILSAVRLSA
jgi:hypothetical protein